MPACNELRKRNLDAIRAVAPAFHDQLAAHQPVLDLVFDGAGNPDVQCNGKSAFGKPVGEHFAEQLAAVDGGVQRFEMRPPEIGDLDFYASRFKANVLRRAKNSGITFGSPIKLCQSYFLVVIGVGLGTHINELIERTRCQSLILVDTGLEFFYHSTKVFDWCGLIDKLSQRHAKIDFVVNFDPTVLAKTLANLFRRHALTAMDGTSVFIDRNNQDLCQAWENFVESHASNVTTAVGFFNDECLMLQNTHANLRAGDPTIFARCANATIDTPAFIVTSGPSFDVTVSYLQKNADNAVVISCGTALKPLLVNGIVPDFHVEIENIAVLAPLADVAKEFDLSNICLLCATTVEHGASNLFGRTIQYFRPELTPYHLFSGSIESSLAIPGPGVANTALSFVLETGFRTVYFWGLDLGVKGTGRHHAKDSYHFVEGALRVLADYEYPMTVMGNFGGKVQTSAFLDQCRDNIELALRIIGNRCMAYNCSDGVAIEGAAPTLPEAVNLPDTNKRQAVEQLIAGMSRFTRDQFEASWRETAFLAAVHQLADRCTEVTLLDSGLRDNVYLRRLMDFLHIEHLTTPPALTSMEHAASSLFRGSLLGVLFTLGFYWNRVSDRNLRADAERIMCEEFRSCVEALQAAAVKMIKNIEVLSGPDSTDAAAYDKEIPEIEYTWGKVARNAPCPCGSGKKYKHCHGKF